MKANRRVQEAGKEGTASEDDIKKAKEVVTETKGVLSEDS
jgi:hypothetical protein